MSVKEHREKDAKGADFILTKKRWNHFFTAFSFAKLFGFLP